MEKINISVNMKATGKRINDLRKGQHITVCEMMDALGLNSDQAIYKWMRGDSLPTLDHLLRMTVLLDCEVEDIIVGRIDAGEGESPLSFCIREIPIVCASFYPLKKKSNIMVNMSF